MDKDRQFQIERYLKNQLDLYLLEGMSCYFLDEEQWMEELHYDILWETFTQMQEATEGLGCYLFGESHKREALEELTFQMLGTMFQVLKPMMDIMKGMANKKEFEEFMVHFQWISSANQWIEYQTKELERNKGKNIAVYELKMKELIGNPQNEIVNEKMKKAIKELRRQCQYPK